MLVCMHVLLLTDVVSIGGSVEKNEQKSDLKNKNSILLPLVLYKMLYSVFSLDLVDT